MTIFAGNTRVIYAAIQSGKGAAAATPTHRFVLSGDSAMDPARAMIQLPETDASSQQPDDVVVGANPAGGWQGWLRSSEFAFLARAVMGVNADSGTNPNFTHTATPSQAMPYLTIWDVIPGVQCTKFVDVRISSLTVSGEALAGITYSVQAIALSALLNEVEPVAPAASATDRQLAYPDVKVTVGGAWTGTHDSFSITVNRNVTVLRGDSGLTIYDSAPGLFGVEGTMRRIYESDDQFNQFHGGSAAATALTPTIFEETLDILVEENANRSVRFTSSAIRYVETAVPVNTDGTPILMTRTFRTKRQATVGNNLTIVTKNGLATSVTSPT